jgi:putative hemolysin
MSFFAELGIFLAIICAHGLLSLILTALASARPARLEQLAAGKTGHFAAALALIAMPHRYQPALQAGAVLCGTLAAVFSGIAFVGPLGQRLATALPAAMADQSQTIAFAIVVACAAFASWVLGEMAPKRFALAHAEAIAVWSASPTQAICRLAGPVVWLAEAVTSLLVGLEGSTAAKHSHGKQGHGKQGDGESTVSIEDIEHLMRAGAKQGVLDDSEQLVARRALRLGDRTVREIMRPRIEIDALDVDTPPEEVIGAVAMSGFSRVPIHEGDLDHIIGFVYSKDLLLRQHMGWPIELRKLVRPALLVPQSLRIDRLLERFRKQRTQMAIVLDEFGGTQGLVTMEDVLEELVGEIHDEHRADRDKRPGRQIIQRDERSWQVDASLPLRDLLEYLGDEAPSDLPIEASTVGGLVLFVLGRIPDLGDVARWRHLVLEVDALEGRRVERLVVRREL